MGKAGGPEVDGRTPAGEAAVHVAAMADAPLSCTPSLLDGTLALSLAPTLKPKSEPNTTRSLGPHPHPHPKSNPTLT